MRVILKVFSFLLIVIGTLVTTSCFLALRILNSQFIEEYLKSNNYYKITQEDVVKKMKELVTNLDIQDAITEMVTLEKIESDIHLYLNKDGNKVKIQSELYELIASKLSDKKYDDKDLVNLTKDLELVYKDNLFPEDVYNEFLNKIPFNAIKKVTIGSLCIVVIGVALSIIAKGFISVITVSGILLSLTFAFPYIFVKSSKVIEDIYVLNNQYSDFVKRFAYNVLSNLLYIGIGIFVFTILVQFLRFYKNRKEGSYGKR